MRHLVSLHTTSTVLAAIIGAGIGIAANHLDWGWLATLAAAAVAALVFAAVRALRRANAQHAQIVREEVDEPRALEAERRELTDPDPFNTELRVEYRTPPTDTGETR
jgi:phosphate/sulfate permease